MAGDTPALGVLLGVVALLEESFDVIEADFQRFYGLDLGEVCWGENHVGVRRLMALIKGLPAESSWSRSRDGWWTERDELLASLVELTYDVSHSSRVTAMGTVGKKFPKFEPLRIPRPGDKPNEPEERPPLSRSEVRAALRCA